MQHGEEQCVHGLAVENLVDGFVHRMDDVVGFKGWPWSGFLLVLTMTFQAEFGNMGKGGGGGRWE